MHIPSNHINLQPTIKHICGHKYPTKLHVPAAINKDNKLKPGYPHKYIKKSPQITVCKSCTRIAGHLPDAIIAVESSSTGETRCIALSGVCAGGALYWVQPKSMTNKYTVSKISTASVLIPVQKRDKNKIKQQQFSGFDSILDWSLWCRGGGEAG